MRGKVSKYQSSKGGGTIVTGDGSRVFFHDAAFEGSMDRPPQEGDMVEFAVIEQAAHYTGSSKAKNVRFADCSLLRPPGEHQLRDCPSQGHDKEQTPDGESERQTNVAAAIDGSPREADTAPPPGDRARWDLTRREASGIPNGTGRVLGPQGEVRPNCARRWWRALLG